MTATGIKYWKQRHQGDLKKIGCRALSVVLRAHVTSVGVCVIVHCNCGQACAAPLVEQRWAYVWVVCFMQLQRERFRRFKDVTRRRPLWVSLCACSCQLIDWHRGSPRGPTNDPCNLPPAVRAVKKQQQVSACHSFEKSMLSRVVLAAFKQVGKTKDQFVVSCTWEEDEEEREQNSEEKHATNWLELKAPAPKRFVTSALAIQLVVFALCATFKIQCLLSIIITVSWIIISIISIVSWIIISIISTVSCFFKIRSLAAWRGRKKKANHQDRCRKQNKTLPLSYRRSNKRKEYLYLYLECHQPTVKPGFVRF